MKKNVTLILFSFLIVSIVSAQKLFTEDFNYSTGSLTSVSGGTWVHSSGNTLPIQVVSGNLSYPGYTTNPTQNGMVMLDTAKENGEDAYIEFSQVNAGTIYCSFLLDILNKHFLLSNNSDSGEYFISFLPSQSNRKYVGGIAIKKGADGKTVQLGIFARVDASLGISWAPQSYPINTTMLIAFSYEFVAGDNNNVASLWINPPTVGAQPAPDAQKTDIDIDGSGYPKNIGRLILLQRSLRSPLCYIDAIKVSTTWEDAVLPLRLLSFNVADKNGYASLSWQTCNEINVKDFEVQKSTDAQNFSTIGTVVAKNSSCGTTYTYADPKQLAGTAFYRIKMVDKDGKATYSGVVRIDGKLPASLSVFPNPVLNTLTLSHPKAETGAVIKIVSMSGLVAVTHNVEKDNIQTSIDVSKLAKGNYIVIFKSSQQQQTININKQ